MKTRFSNNRRVLLIVGAVISLVLSFVLLLSPSISVSFASSSNRHATALTPAQETQTVEAAVTTAKNAINANNAAAAANGQSANGAAGACSGGGGGGGGNKAAAAAVPAAAPRI